MMKTALCACLLLTLVYGATQRYPAANPEDIPAEYAGRKGCYIPSRSLFLEVGVESYPDLGQRCTVLVCQENGETIENSCGALAIQDGCRRQAGNLSIPYPGCCDTEECC